MNKDLIKIHIDDLGIFPNHNNRMIDSIIDGRVDGASVIVNSKYYEECMKDYFDRVPEEKRIPLSLHMVVMEGRPVCDASEVPHLVDKNGIFNCSFSGLMMASLIPGIKAVYRSEMAKEIRAQIDKLIPYLNGAALRLDSHCHYHMTPVFFDAMMDVVKELDYPVSKIRIPMEHKEFYKAAGIKAGFMNKIKVFLLNFYSKKALKKYKNELSSYEERVFFGVMESGHMKADHIVRLSEIAEAYCINNNCDMEFLMHPGRVMDGENENEITHAGDRKDMTSIDRDTERSENIKLKELLG